jgi:hypothetical protein
MSNGDAYQDEMGATLMLDDRELDRLLAGQEPGGDRGDLEELATFFRELPLTFAAAPEAPTEARHLSAIMDAIRLVPMAEEAPGKRGWLGKAPRTVRIAFAAALVLGLFGGVAYAGELPGPVQHAVADVASHVGVGLPGAHDNKSDGAANDKSNGEHGNLPAGTHKGTGTSKTPQSNRGTGHQGSHGQTGGSQDGNSGNQGHANESGTSGASGADQSNNLDQGTQGQSGGSGTSSGSHGSATQGGQGGHGGQGGQGGQGGGTNGNGAH